MTTEMTTDERRRTDGCGGGRPGTARRRDSAARIDEALRRMAARGAVYALHDLGDWFRGLHARGIGHPVELGEDERVLDTVASYVEWYTAGGEQSAYGGTPELPFHRPSSSAFGSNWARCLVPVAERGDAVLAVHCGDGPRRGSVWEYRPCRGLVLLAGSADELMEGLRRALAGEGVFPSPERGPVGEEVRVVDLVEDLARRVPTDSDRLDEHDSEGAVDAALHEVAELYDAPAARWLLGDLFLVVGRLGLDTAGELVDGIGLGWIDVLVDTREVQERAAREGVPAEVRLVPISRGERRVAVDCGAGDDAGVVWLLPADGPAHRMWDGLEEALTGLAQFVG